MKAKFIFSLAFFCTAKLLSQDIDYISPTTNWLQLNPAYAGSNGGFRSQVNNCHSPGFYGTNQTGIANDLYLKKIKSGISLSLNNFNLGRGILIENSFAIGYSKRIPVKKLEIMPALQITALQRRLDINALNFGDYIDARWNERFLDFTGGNLPATRKNVVDINFGALVKLSQAFVVGFTAKHITQPDVGLNGFAQMPAKYVVHASYDKVINENSLISVLAWLTEQGGTEEAKLQTSVVLKKHLYTGLGAGVSNNYSSGLVNLGYRGNYWSVSVFLGTQYYPETKSFWNSSQLSISANIRDKEHRRTLTALYSW